MPKNARLGAVYFLDTNLGTKIGFTNQDLHARLMAFHKNFQFRFWHAIQHESPYLLEQHFHHEFRLARNPNVIKSTEIFRLTERQRQYVLSMDTFGDSPCIHLDTLANADSLSTDRHDALWGYRAKQREIVLPSGMVCVLPKEELSSQMALLDGIEGLE